MKSFLTFTLAAGVAVTASSIAHGEGTSKARAATGESTSISKQAPATIGTMSGLFLDRTALNRELSKLQEDIELGDTLDEATTPVRSTRKAAGIWTF
jgi:hypothetical protein